MNQPHDLPLNELPPDGEPVNVSRRRFLLASAGTAAGSLVVGFTLPAKSTRAGLPGNPSRQQHPPAKSLR
ncbi:twin-arginine translocation signal domain-containing protein [Herbaspirillum huttiense]|uniref:twin-arginine translocation signal domain-containing protein n=1 Tax=Herbaspirillum huttiense TaxID=863372 RepID=UPI0003FB2531|nr:twin-arginine translocation signal domain-containing protein [Herbaspirillum huttiense]